jgi:hypothetical protein
MAASAAPRNAGTLIAELPNAKIARRKNYTALDADCLTNPTIAAIFAPLVRKAKRELQCLS